MSDVFTPVVKMMGDWEGVLGGELNSWEEKE